MIDVPLQIDAVRRQVGRRKLAQGKGRTVTLAQVFAAPIEDVWAACTEAERIPQWFLPVSGDLELGGEFQLEGNAGGTIERCAPPRSFDATWEFDGDVSWIELRLRAVDEGTELELTHIAKAGGPQWAEYGPGAVGIGWDMALVGLTLLLTTGKPVDGEQTATWLGGDGGRQFISLSSIRWGEASIAAGTERTAARDAADRTTAIYTGDDDED